MQETQRNRFNPCLGKIPWRKKWQPTPVSLLENFHWQRPLVGCSPWGQINNLEVTDEPDKINSCTTGTKNLFRFKIKIEIVGYFLKKEKAKANNLTLNRIFYQYFCYDCFTLFCFYSFVFFCKLRNSRMFICSWLLSSIKLWTEEWAGEKGVM